jgi:hypothetical protein
MVTLCDLYDFLRDYRAQDGVNWTEVDVEGLGKGLQKLLVFFSREFSTQGNDSI